MFGDRTKSSANGYSFKDWTLHSVRTSLYLFTSYSMELAITVSKAFQFPWFLCGLPASKKTVDIVRSLAQKPTKNLKT